jgi:hypothetical protein
MFRCTYPALDPVLLVVMDPESEVRQGYSNRDKPTMWLLFRDTTVPIVMDISMYYSYASE